MMIIDRPFVTDFIQCPQKFGRNILQGRQSTIRVEDMNLQLKKHLVEIAAFEMQNDHKFTLAEYRVKFTNKFYTKATQVLSDNSIVNRLNNLLDTFANNKFIGYNVPVEIPIEGTSIMYRSIVDFILKDEDDNITIVEIQDLSDYYGTLQRYKYWPHYAAVYGYIADRLDCNVTLQLIDPVNFLRVDLEYTSLGLMLDLKKLFDLVKPMGSDTLWKNLFACKGCDYIKDCFAEGEINESIEMQ